MQRKRAKRVAEKKKNEREQNRIIWETTLKMSIDAKKIEQEKLLEEAKRKRELEAVEAKEALKLARKNRRLLMQHQR